MSGGRVVTFSPGQSQISTDVSTLAADGVAVCTVYITAYNTDQTSGEPNPMSNLRGSAYTIAVTPSTGVVITQPTGTANAGGTAIATFTSTNAATVTVSATVLGVAASNTASVVVGGGAPVPPAPGDPFFEEDFTGLAFNNANGFVWGSQNGAVNVVSFDGFNCCRFRYGPNGTDVEDTSEKRFNMGQQLSEVWIEYYLHLPSNYSHRNDPGPTNNKIIRLWGDSYSSWSKVGASTYSQAAEDATSATSNFYFECVNFATTGIGTNSSSNTGPIDFGANSPVGTLLNRWTRVRFRFKAPTVIGPGADSVMQMWLDDDLVYTWNTTVSNLDPDDNFYQNGYLFGWSNSGFAAETDTHVRALKFYDTDPGWT